MICLIALIVFGILGIFSAAYRSIAKEAFGCVFRKITLRPCESNLNERLKAQIVASILSRWPAAAVQINKHFETISWIFTILMLASFVLSAQAVYNFYAFGNCNGPNSSAFCIFNPTGSHVGIDNKLVYPADLTGPSIGPKNASLTIIEFGCFTCPYTQEAFPTVKRIIDEYCKGDVRFVFKYFPLKNHNYSIEAAEAAACADEQGKFFEYSALLFKDPKLNTPENMKAYANQVAGLNISQFNQCLDSKKYASTVEKSFQTGLASGIYGTPTFFIGNSTIVGPKSYEEMKRIVDAELKGVSTQSNGTPGLCASPTPGGNQ